MFHLQNIAGLAQFWPLIPLVLLLIAGMWLNRLRHARQRTRRREERRRYTETLQNAWMLVMRRPRNLRLTDQRRESE